MNFLLVGLGGFLGAVSRYGIAVWVGQNWGRNFPLGTFVVNVSGSFFLGLIMGLFTGRFMVNPQWKLFLAVGFLGSYTTFSTFEFETGNLLQDGEWMLATMNVVFSVLAGFIALKAGDVIAKAL